MFPALQVSCRLGRGAASRARGVFAATSRSSPTHLTTRTFASHRPASEGPQSDSSAEASVKSKRGLDGAEGTERGGSTAEPVSGKGDVTGQSEEGGAPEKGGVGKDSVGTDAADKK